MKCTCAKPAIRGVVVAVLLFCAASARSATYGDFTYTDNGTAITNDHYTGTGGAVSIPNIIIHKPVTTIGNSAFTNCTGLTSLLIP